MTNAKVTIADYPFATTVPVPGMVKFEDVQFELIDMPPITEQFCTPGQIDTYRHCDLIAIVIDLSGDIAGQVKTCINFLESRNLIGEQAVNLTDADRNLFSKKAFYLGTKSDIAQPESIETLQKLSTYPFEIVTVSVKTREGIAELAAKLFKILGLIRVYTKPPGKKPDLTEPFTLPAGSTVHDLASAIHKELSEKLKDARIWGTGVYNGQNVQRNHILNDKDIVELHFA
jgi:ribosome-interacting GTPase 1